MAAPERPAMEIKGEQHTVGELFSERFAFAVPPYQRQYVWKPEHAEELLDDLLQSLGEGNLPVEHMDPYFLGSIVLIRQDRQEFEIVDGQQRLVTLTILLAVLRELIPAAYRESITNRLLEPADPLRNIPARYRLRLKAHDADFFRVYIQSEGGIRRLRDQPHDDPSEGQRNMIANAMAYLKSLENLPEERCLRLAQFVMQRCLLVVISTPALESAYRVFTVMNDRGVDLTPADILKAEIIGPIPSHERDDYTARWERVEETLGSGGLSELLSHIRTIYASGVKADNLDTFRKQIMAHFGDSRRLIDDALVPYGSAYAIILHQTYEHTDINAELACEVNDKLRWLAQVGNHDWVPPALVYLKRYHDQPARLLSFLTALERLAASFAICQQYAHRRQPRYSRVLGAIERGANLADAASPIQLTQAEREATLLALDGDLYLMPPTPRNYVLKRLDRFLADGAATYDTRKFTVEHVLPRNPKPGSEWTQWFPTPQLRAKWVHRLGNLVLLTRDKNSDASNYDFARKKKTYFTSYNGVTPYALTTQVLKEEVWTPEVVERRQRELIGKLRELWRL